MINARINIKETETVIITPVIIKHFLSLSQAKKIKIGSPGSYQEGCFLGGVLNVMLLL
jgi:hypothetical protein